jgi:recombinational DNA repair protein (RecF pathway)
MTPDCWNNEEKLQAAKRLMRQVLSQLLGNKPLHSRKLFV